MATDSLIFPCPACGIKLSVPLSLAGISGPCPSCWMEIQSPRADDPPCAVIAPVAARETEHAEPPRETGGIPAAEPEPNSAESPAAMDWPVPALSKPVARALPKRAVPEEIILPPETRIGSMWNALPAPLPQPSPKTLQWLRFLIAALCVGGAAALAYFAAR